MNKLNLIILVLIGVALFIFGSVLGGYYQMQKLEPQLSAVRALSSEVVPSIVAYGQVTKIDNNDLTLTYGEGTVTIRVRDNAPVYYLMNSSSGEETKEIRLRDLKVGDNVHVSINVSSNGKLEGTTVAVSIKNAE